MKYVYRVFTLRRTIGLDSRDPSIAEALETEIAMCLAVLREDTEWDDWRLASLEWGQAVFEHAA